MQNLSRPYLTALKIGFIVVLISSNWLESRFINILGFDFGAGVLIFPLTYLLSDIITEVYGYKNARLTVWIAFLASTVIIACNQLANLIPSSQSFAFLVPNGTLDFDARITAASAISYFLTETLNSYIVARLKIRLKGKFMGIRFLLSTLSVHAINIIIFCPIAFYGRMTNEKLLVLMISSWVLMVLIGLIFLTVAVRLAIKLKQVEHLDIYDKDTKFNILSFNTEYSQDNNQYQGHD